MRDLLAEFEEVMRYSKRSAWIFLFGMLFTLVFKAFGLYLLVDVVCNGPTFFLCGGMARIINGGAILCFILTFAASIKFYLQDRKRLYKL